MQNDVDSLPDDVEQLKKLLLFKDREISQLKQQYQDILEQFRLAQHKQFGKSSEVSVEQLGLFNEAEEITEQVEAQPKAAQITETTPVKKPKRQPLPQDLPREIIIHDLSEEDKTCDGCGHQLHQMGAESSEQLEFVPAHIKVVEHKRPKYSCRHCEKVGVEVTIKIAPPPATPIPKSVATASLLSQIITSKYQYALPLYRQESLFKQYFLHYVFL